MKASVPHRQHDQSRRKTDTTPMPRPKFHALRRLNPGHAQTQACGGLPPWDAVRALGRGLMGGLLGLLIDALWPDPVKESED